MHCCPDGQEHCFVFPHPSVMVPQRFVFWSGVHDRTPQPASCGPASLGVGVTHWLATHVSPVGHPPQLTPTPHESAPMTPHFPVHEGA
jgi:hypothetical protein